MHCCVGQASGVCSVRARQGEASQEAESSEKHPQRHPALTPQTHLPHRIPSTQRTTQHRSTRQHTHLNPITLLYTIRTSSIVLLSAARPAPSGCERCERWGTHGIAGQRRVDALRSIAGVAPPQPPWSPSYPSSSCPADPPGHSGSLRRARPSHSPLPDRPLRLWFHHPPPPRPSVPPSFEPASMAGSLHHGLRTTSPFLLGDRSGEGSRRPPCTSRMCTDHPLTPSLPPPTTHA